MIPVSTLSNSNQPKSSLCAAAEKRGFFFYHLNVFQLLQSGLLLTFPLHMDMIVLVWRLTMSGNVTLTKKRPVYLHFLLPISSVL